MVGDIGKQMLFGRIFLAINGLIGLALGTFVAVSSSLSSVGIDVQGYGLIEVRAAVGGAWICLGLFWLINAFGRRLRSSTATLGVFYAVTAAVRFLAMQDGGATNQTLMFLAFELVIALISLLLFVWALAPERRRIFG